MSRPPEIVEGAARGCPSYFCFDAPQRYARIGQAMSQGKVLPAIDVYELRCPRRCPERVTIASEYYVVDGHHRVAIAKKLGVDFLDAHVVLYRASVSSND